MSFHLDAKAHHPQFQLFKALHPATVPRGVRHIDNELQVFVLVHFPFVSPFAFDWLRVKAPATKCINDFPKRFAEPLSWNPFSVVER
jgi:hypothetical protein